MSTDPLNQSAPWQCKSCQLCVSAQDVMRLDSKLIEELSRVNRAKTDNLEKFHAAYTPHLHPNHSFLMQLKQWMFEAYGKQVQEATSSIPIAPESYQEVTEWIRRAVQLGDELLAVFDKVEAELSFIRGIEEIF